jgi:hypothetical protein
VRRAASPRPPAGHTPCRLPPSLLPASPVGRTPRRLPRSLLSAGAPASRLPPRCQPVSRVGRVPWPGELFSRRVHRCLHALGCQGPSSSGLGCS